RHRSRSVPWRRVRFPQNHQGRRASRRCRARLRPQARPTDVPAAGCRSPAFRASGSAWPASGRSDTPRRSSGIVAGRGCRLVWRKQPRVRLHGGQERTDPLIGYRCLAVLVELYRRLLQEGPEGLLADLKPLAARVVIAGGLIVFGRFHFISLVALTASLVRTAIIQHILVRGWFPFVAIVAQERLGWLVR